MKAKNYLQGISTNNKQIIKSIYDDFSPMIVKYVTSNSGSTTDAKDVMQDAMIVIYNKIRKDDLKLSSSFQTYLFSVCRFIWLRNLKKNSKEVITSSFKDTLTVEDGLEERLIESQKQTLMKAKFENLSPECKELLQYTFNGMRGKEIAERMNYTIEFVKRKKFRCKNALIRAVKADPEYYFLSQKN